MAEKRGAIDEESESDLAAPLAGAAIRRLGLSEAAQKALLSIQAELWTAYQRSFLEMTQAVQRQASAIERLQTTLTILVKHMAPDLASQMPAAFRVVAHEDESPDLATAVVTADPIAAGYTMTQTDLAKALSVPQSDVSILVKAFNLVDEDDCAVVVRQGKSRQIVNYHPRAVARFRELVARPPRTLSRSAKRALDRVTKRLVVGSSQD